MDARAFSRVLRELAKVPSKIAKVAAPRLTDRLRSGFADGVDPYGNEWAPLAPRTLAKGRTPPPLTESGDLAGGTEVRPLRGAGLGLFAPETLSRGAPASIHMTGDGAKLPARPYLPQYALPATWRAELQAIYSKLMRAR